jgi:hypothetical protein
LPGVANAKTLKDIVEWICIVAPAFVVFVLDNLVFIFHKTFSKSISEISFSQSMKSGQ